LGRCRERRKKSRIFKRVYTLKKESGRELPREDTSFGGKIRFVSTL